MAEKVAFTLVDDLDGSPANETVQFSIDGVAYEIELSDEHGRQLRTQLQPFIAAARPTTGTSTSSSQSALARPESEKRRQSAAVRAWAQEHGLAVPRRGRIAADVWRTYHAREDGAAHPATTESAPYRARPSINPFAVSPDSSWRAGWQVTPGRRKCLSTR